MIKSKLSRILDLDADDISISALKAVEEAIKVDDQFRASKEPSALTLDERSNLFLNAVYGSRAFTSDDYSEARNALLDAMASNLFKDHSPDTGELGEEGFAVRETPHEAFRTMRAAYSRDVRPPMAGSSMPPSRDNSASSGRSADVAFLPDENAQFQRPPMETSDRKTNRLSRAPRFGAIAAILSLAILSAAVSYLVLNPSNSGHSFADLSLDRLRQIQQKTPTRETVQTRQLSSIDSSEIARRLLEVGSRLITNGDLYGGRIVLAEAVDAGSAAAALQLGSSFDPVEDERRAMSQRVPLASTPLASSARVAAATLDPEMARFWYERAKQLGDPEAQARLDRLAGRGR